MTVFITRLFLLWLSGFLMSSGWINVELQQMLLTDQSIADAIQVVLSAVSASAWLGLWRLAKHMGWTT